MGGIEATRGFYIQALTALFRSLPEDDWAAFEVEPEEDTEKVDIWWQDANGSILRRAQVKSLLDPFGLPETRRWATAVAKAGAGSRLYLIGPLTGPLSKAIRNDRLDVPTENLAASKEHLVSLCSEALHQALHELHLGSRSPELLRQACVDLAGVIFARSAERDPWTRQKLVGMVAKLTQPHGSAPLLPDTVLWEQVRLIEVHGSGDSTEVWVDMFTNNGPVVIPAPGCQVWVTDGEAEATAAQDNAEGTPEWWEYEEEDGGCFVWVAPFGELNPGDTRWIAVRVHRVDVASVDRGGCRYSDAIRRVPHKGIWVDVVALPPARCPLITDAGKAETITPGAVAWRLERSKTRRFDFVATGADAQPEVGQQLRRLMDRLLESTGDGEVRVREDLVGPALSRLLALL